MDSVDIKVLSQRRERKLEEFLRDFQYKPDYLKKLAKHVRDGIGAAYAQQFKIRQHGGVLPKNCEFKALDTCISNLPTGNERGIVYGVDIGSTHIRVLRLTLLGRGQCKQPEVYQYEMKDPNLGFPKGLLDRKCPASTFFDVIAECVQNLVEANNDVHRKILVGLTFPFPIRMDGIRKAIVIGLAKEFETGSEGLDPLIGQDAVGMLEFALRRTGLRAFVTGCVNDTASTLVTAGYKVRHHQKLPMARVGMIISAGFNTCIMDESAYEYGYSGCLVNLEAGALRCQDHICDIYVDYASVDPGAQKGEKKIAANYLPELCRYCLIEVLESDAPPNMYMQHTLTIQQTGHIFEHHASDNSTKVRVVSAIMRYAFDWTPPYKEMCYYISEVVHAVWDRSAALVAAVMAGAADKTGRLRTCHGGVTVGIDGSLYSQNPAYQKRVRKYLRVILGDRHRLLHVLISSHGAGKGAAMLGCTHPCDDA